jgi:hypothetical protein
VVFAAYPMQLGATGFPPGSSSIVSYMVQIEPK